jgi:hypothetical protein
MKANVDMIPTNENVWVNLLSLFTYFAYPPKTIPESKAIIRVAKPKRKCSILLVIAKVPFTIYGFKGVLPNKIE